MAGDGSKCELAGSLYKTFEAQQPGEVVFYGGQSNLQFIGTAVSAASRSGGLP